MQPRASATPKTSTNGATIPNLMDSLKIDCLKPLTPHRRRPASIVRRVVPLRPDIVNETVFLKAEPEV